MPRAVTLGTKTWIGRLIPRRIGPTGNPSLLALSKLKAMLAASRPGITSRLAVPESRLSGTARSRIASLSHREFVIFRLLAQGHSPGDCAHLLNLSAKTVANNQTLIKEKLGVKTSAGLVHLALRNGIIVHDHT